MNFDKEAPRELKKSSPNLLGIAILKNDTKG